MTPEETTALLMTRPFFRFLDFTIVDIEDRQVSGRMPFSENYIGNPVMNYYHGGIIASVMEVVASVAVWQDLEQRSPKPINLTVDYLRPAIAEPLNVRAVVLRKGRRMASVQAVSWQAEPENPVAKGLFHFLVM
ncbi:MAG: PaaI family thioesterase [Hyphomicrobiaceae bacterium]